jgi:predicted nuclease of predicted toxin-antitoxin system
VGETETVSRIQIRTDGEGIVAKFLIDECLHTSLLKLAHEAGHNADHVNYLGLGSSKDWDLMKLILDQDYTFVTNNRTDFLVLYGRAHLHAGLVIIVPNVTPTLQRELFHAALNFIGERELINAVVEVEYRSNEIECRQYPIPPE